MTEPQEREDLARERDELLHRIEKWLETPMIVLGFVWLALLVLELTRGLSSELETAATVIWIAFILDFALRFVLAPHKADYLQGNWLTAISLVLPALRVFRIVRVVQVLRAARATRGLRLLKLFGSLNRGMRALGRTMGRRGFGYVAALTLLVTLAGAAGMHYFERGQGLDNFGTALWWTTMIMTTLGSEYWPKTAEGRVLCVVLALYAFAVFGYVTATIATFFLGRDAEDPEAEVAGAAAIEMLRGEIAALREEIRALSPQQRPG
ncbi:MAG: ion transporter [Gemmatimonadetes bacterium]|jgi:voltage-gated potassium channel|nr:ion transporter [Gemmatimonadota bacterium]MBA3969157.1 ion transporter [Gemmatimonadota bacterium]MDQ3522280.1 ion transporter [Gemmatimonadota bacterium]